MKREMTLSEIRDRYDDWGSVKVQIETSNSLSDLFAEVTRANQIPDSEQTVLVRESEHPSGLCDEMTLTIIFQGTMPFWY
jgi:hypothetical protein